MIGKNRERSAWLQSRCGFAKVSLMKTSTAVISIQDLTAEAIPVLRQALAAVTGVQKIDFSLERSVAVVEFDGKHSKVDDLLRAVLKAGFKLV